MTDGVTGVSGTAMKGFYRNLNGVMRLSLDSDRAGLSGLYSNLLSGLQDAPGHMEELTTMDVA